MAHVITSPAASVATVMTGLASQVQAYIRSVHAPDSTGDAILSSLTINRHAAHFSWLRTRFQRNVLSNNTV